MPVGRPPLWKSKEELEEKIEEFYLFVKENRVPPTLERLAWVLGCERTTIRNYSLKDEFFYTIKRVKDYVVSSQTEMLYGGKGSCPGIIFGLCNNVADEYSQKQETKIVSESKISIEVPRDDDSTEEGTD